MILKLSLIILVIGLLVALVYQQYRDVLAPLVSIVRGRLGLSSRSPGSKRFSDFLDITPRQERLLEQSGLAPDELQSLLSYAKMGRVFAGDLILQLQQGILDVLNADDRVKTEEEPSPKAIARFHACYQDAIDLAFKVLGPSFSDELLPIHQKLKTMSAKNPVSRADLRCSIDSFAFLAKRPAVDKLVQVVKDNMGLLSLVKPFLPDRLIQRLAQYSNHQGN